MEILVLSNMNGTHVSVEEDSELNLSKLSTEFRSISRGHNMNHQMSSPSDQLVVHTKAIDLQVSWDWDSSSEEETSHSKSTTQSKTRWIQVQ